MSNYPDDIRSYDSDPRSPFYNGDVLCSECGDEMGEIDIKLFRCNGCDITQSTEPEEEERLS